MTNQDVRAALAALAAELPQEQGEDEVSLAEAGKLLGKTDLGTVQRLIEARGWTCVGRRVLRNGKTGRVWKMP